MSNFELPSRSLPVVITEAGICVVLNITSIIGNSLVCIAAYRNPNLRSTTNLYIIALAVSDLLCATIEMPLASTTLIIGRWDFSDVLCQIQGFVDGFTTYATPATLGLTAINRYVKIVKTNLYKKYFSPLRSKIWLCCVWTILVLYILTGRATDLLSFEFVPGFEVCALGFADMRVQIVHFSIVLGLFFIVPLFSGMFSYYKVISSTHQHQENTNASLHSRDNCGGSSSLKEIHVTRILLCVAAGFLFCWIPMWAFILWKRFSPETCSRRVALLVSFFLFLSATINPFIYAFTNCNFRKEFRKLLCCCHASNEVAAADINEIREMEDEANV
ncbi:kappa-type opioid receptor-like [Stylophora pistillata]|uniref:kappa-type opioid receptor-like n=1 Tax=Stylophora pistillata TaxID=50429 RepID=UPI000C056925|nr:kappa-type opioid receptor-like [Stylophora pistillata]